MLDIVAHDILAGLTFAHSALKNDSSAVHYGDSLIWLIEQNDGEKTWVFPHDSTTNYLDVHVTLALSYYALSDFTESLGHVQKIKTALNPASPPWLVNTNTIVGRNQLAAEIEYLQNYLQDSWYGIFEYELCWIINFNDIGKFCYISQLYVKKQKNPEK